jgi:DNA-binding ferritin-like protein
MGVMPVDEFNRQLLTKLTESFDDFKERLIRIEENVKSVKDVKEDVDILKLKVASVESKASSAHKRLDTIDKDVDEIPTIKENTKRIDKLEKVVWFSTTTLILTMIAIIGYLWKNGGQ